MDPAWRCISEFPSIFNRDIPASYVSSPSFCGPKTSGLRQANCIDLLLTARPGDGETPSPQGIVLDLAYLKGLVWHQTRSKCLTTSLEKLASRTGPDIQWDCKRDVLLFLFKPFSFCRVCGQGLSDPTSYNKYSSELWFVGITIYLLEYPTSIS